MRQIYSSQRNENIDRVVALMAEAGIATSVINRRNFGGHDYKGASYTSKVDRNLWPQVWVVHADDQARARAMLRDIGLEPPIRFAEEVAQSRKPQTGADQKRAVLTRRLRTLLLAAIFMLLVLNWLGALHLF